ncbi:MAG: glycoside hydrolase family protein [Pseudomonadales bacterium]
MLERLRKDLEHDEGVRHEIYLDHLGLPTAGIGHLLVEGDPEYALDVGTPVSKERVDEWFAVDIKNCLEDCANIFMNWEELPDEAKCILANMAFNLGGTRLRKFSNMIDAIHREDFETAADEMHDSRWRRQVPQRAGRLITRMRAIG